jgi:ABC-type nitrate/sulfonate/bicarbonate transport system substrate-binding protein
MLKTIRLLIAATLTIVGVSATNSQAMAQGKKVTVGINSLTAIYWPTYVARAKGLYARHGLDADIVLVGSPVAGVQQLIGRSIDIAHPTLYVAVNALAHGADLRLIGCIVNTLPYSMIASPKLTSVKDLVGKSVILAFRTDVMTLMWRDWVKAQGVDPEGIDQIYDAQAANRYAALGIDAERAVRSPRAGRRL